MRVLVVGAGLAGLTCGRILAAHGVDVAVLEASDGVGGRVRSDYHDGYIFDRGFQVLFDAYPAVRRHIDLAALSLQAFDPGAVICFNGRRTVLTDPLRDRSLRDIGTALITPVATLRDKLQTLALSFALRSQSIAHVLAGEDTSTLSYLKHAGFSDQIIDSFFRPFYAGIFLDRSLATSAKCFKYDFKMLSEGNTVVPARGIGALSEQLAAPLVQQQRITYNCAAHSLVRFGECVSGVRTVNGEEHIADAVVIATPAPEAARLTGINTPRGLVQTVTLYFAGDEPITRTKKIILNAAPDAFVNNVQLLTNIAPSYAPAGKHLLGASIIGIPDMEDAALYQAALRDLHRMFAGDAQALAALACYQPLRLYRIPYAQFAQPAGFHSRLPNNVSEQKGLYFAAEWTEASSINAAMVSGEKCAAALLAHAI